MVDIAPITLDDVESFHACLDAVARERRYLALLEAPPVGHMRDFVRDNITRQVPQLVARDGRQVVGWCDIVPDWHHTLRHCGALGMGLLPAYRGQGLGGRMLAACIALARQRGITRIELDARVDNVAALRLYQRAGFACEGTKERGMLVNGQYIDTVAMALLL